MKNCQLKFSHQQNKPFHSKPNNYPRKIGKLALSLSWWISHASHWWLPDYLEWSRENFLIHWRFASTQKTWIINAIFFISLSSAHSLSFFIIINYHFKEVCMQMNDEKIEQWMSCKGFLSSLNCNYFIPDALFSDVWKAYWDFIEDNWNCWTTGGLK